MGIYWGVPCCLVGLALLSLFGRFLWTSSPCLDHIPSIGPSGPLTSYWGVLKFMFRSREMMQEGCKKYPNGVFKLPRPNGWMVVCCGRQTFEDLRKAGERILCSEDAEEENFQSRYTFGPEIQQNPYHVNVVRQPLTRNLSNLFPDLHDEFVKAFEDTLALEGHDWKSVLNVRQTILQIICRASNRIYVGLPLCRDPDYISLNIQFTINVFVTAGIINAWPAFLRPIIGRLVTSLPTSLKRALRHLSPIIDHRLHQEEQHGKDWAGKPNDAITWLLEKAPPEQRTPTDVAKRLFVLNLAAMHITSLTFTHALYHLAARPELAQILREEVQCILKEASLSKEATDQMHKVDSFLKETARVNALSICEHALSFDPLPGRGERPRKRSTDNCCLTVTSFRKLTQDMTLSNGITLPVGATVVLPVYDVHRDESSYADPEVFEPFRFLRAGESGDEGRPKASLTSPAFEFRTWGMGQHTCPGRFFAALMLKTMIAHVLVNYEVKMKDERVRPADKYVAGVCLPNPDAEVMFRRLRT